MLYDALAGIYLTRTRAYDPKRGRFLERDVLDEDQKDGFRGFPFGADAIGSNLYGWCKNNPVNRIDPSGEWSWRSIGRIIGAVVGSRFGVASLGARIGSAIGRRFDYYSGYYGVRWGRSYSGGGYGWAGHARRAAEKRQKSAPKPPPKVVMRVADISKANPAQKSFLNTPAGQYWYSRTGSFGFSSNADSSTYGYSHYGVEIGEGVQFDFSFVDNGKIAYPSLGVEIGFGSPVNPYYRESQEIAQPGVFTSLEAAYIVGGQGNAGAYKGEPTGGGLEYGVSTPDASVGLSIVFPWGMKSE